MQENNLTGKVVLVTGGAKRIGAGIARKLHAAGMTVVVHHYTSVDAALALQDELNQLRGESCFLVQGDLLEIAWMPELVQNVLAHAGRLDVLVNNASRFYPTPLSEMNEQHWDDLIGTNMKVPLFLAQAAREVLLAHQGCIINMADVHGLRPLAGHAVYSAAKAGLVMLTQALARELGPQIRVNGIAPGAILWPEQGMSSSDQDALLAKTVLQRAGNIEDVARMALFLAKEADYITGQIFPVDGGRMLNH